MLESDDFDSKIGEVRPDWYVPASIVFGTLSKLFEALAMGLGSASQLMVAYSNHADGRLAFHEAAAQELEKIVDEVEEPDA